MTLIIHPEFDKLNKEYFNLKEELSEKLFEMSNLVDQVGPNIENIYLIKFGFLEYKLYDLDIEIDVLKMKLKLIQERINHSKKIDLNEIDEIIEIKFKDFSEKLNSQLNELNSAMEKSKDTTLISKENSKKLRKIYKKIIKTLHPDLNNDISTEERILFFNAVEAYKNGDLKTLESIELILKDNSNENIDDFSLLKEDISKLNLKIKHLDEDILKIKNSFPFNKLNIIEDEEKSLNYESELNSLIENKTILLNKYQNRLNQVLSNIND